MNYQDEIEKLLNETQDKLAEGISTLIRNINNKEQVVDFLRNMKNQPTIDIIKRLYKIAIEKEDFETCEAVKEYAKEKGINLKN